MAHKKPTPSGRGILALPSGVAEEERTRILKRANEGRIAAIKRGTRLGRKSKLDDHQQQEAINRLKAGESSGPSPRATGFTTPPSAGWPPSSMRCAPGRLRRLIGQPLEGPVPAIG
jgi:hypothetical protein